MPVQALYAGTRRKVYSLAYSWAGDGTLLLALDSRQTDRPELTYKDLARMLKTLCSWQLDVNVIVGMDLELAEVLTLYHDFSWPQNNGNTLLLVSTPPDEYFDHEAA